MKQQRYSKRVIIPLVASAAAAVAVASSSSELQSNDGSGVYDDNIPAERHRLREHRQQTNEIQDDLDVSSSSSLVSLAAEPHHHHRERKHNQAKLLLKGQMSDTIQSESRALYQQKRKGHIPGINKLNSLHIASRASDLNVGDITAVRNKTKKKNSSTTTKNAIQARQGHKRGVNAKKKVGKQRQNQNQGGQQRNKTIQSNNKKPKPMNRGGGTQRNKKNMKDNNTRYGGGMKEEGEEGEVNEEKLYREQVKNKMKDRMKNKKMKEQQQETKIHL